LNSIRRRNWKWFKRKVNESLLLGFSTNATFQEDMNTETGIFEIIYSVFLHKRGKIGKKKEYKLIA